MAAPSLPTCSCGHDRTSHWVRPDLKYGFGAWSLLFAGASATPREITFRCGRCGEAFETTRDPAILARYRRYPYVKDEEATPPAP